MHDSLIDRAIELVCRRIPGLRKGTTDEPAFRHSLRVGELLTWNGFADEVMLAGYLHDVVEDGGVTYQELADAGYPPRTIEIVRLCTHDREVPNKDSRWLLMIAGIVRVNDADALAVKLADTIDNARDSYRLQASDPERAKFIRTVKAPLILNVTAGYPACEPLRGLLMRALQGPA